MRADRFLLAFESLATVVMLVVWVAVAIEVEGALRAGAPVPLAAGDACLPRPAHAAASGTSMGSVRPGRGPSRGPGARLLCVEGLGHRRLLSDPQVVAAVAAFVAGSADPMGPNAELVSIAA